MTNSPDPLSTAGAVRERLALLRQRWLLPAALAGGLGLLVLAAFSPPAAFVLAAVLVGGLVQSAERERLGRPSEAAPDPTSVTAAPSRRGGPPPDPRPA